MMEFNRLLELGVFCRLAMRMELRSSVVSQATKLKGALVAVCASVGALVLEGSESCGSFDGTPTGGGNRYVRATHLNWTDTYDGRWVSSDHATDSGKLSAANLKWTSASGVIQTFYEASNSAGLYANPLYPVVATNFPVGSGCFCPERGASLGSIKIAIPIADGDKVYAILRVKEDRPGVEIFDPRSLNLEGWGGLKVFYRQESDRIDEISRILSQDVVADITNFGLGGYRVDVHRVQSIEYINGEITSVDKGQLLQSTQITNLDQSVEPNRLKWEQETNGHVQSSIFEWSDDFLSWSMTEDDGTRVTEIEKTRKAGDSWQEDWVVREAGNPATLNYRFLYNVIGGEDRIVEATAGNGPTVFYSYYNATKLSSIREGDGTWVQYDYSYNGDLVREIRPYGEAAFGSGANLCEIIEYEKQVIPEQDRQDSVLKTAIRKVRGHEVERSYTYETFDENDSRTIVKEDCSAGGVFGASENSRLVLRENGNEVSPKLFGRTKSVEVNGEFDAIYAHVIGDYQIVPEGRGVFVANSDGGHVKEERIYDAGDLQGIRAKSISFKTLEGRELEIENFLELDGTWVSLGWEVYTVDEGGRVIQVSDQFGTVSSTAYSDCCGKIAYSWSRDGTEQIFQYDGLQRLAEQQILRQGFLPIVRKFTYRADDKVSEIETIYGNDSDIQTFDYDNGGRLISESDSTTGELLEYAYADGELGITTTSSFGHVVQVKMTNDGRVESVTGNSSGDEYFDYGVGSIDGEVSEWIKNSTLHADGPRYSIDEEGVSGSRRITVPGFGGDPIVTTEEGGLRGERSSTKTRDLNGDPIEGIPDEITEIGSAPGETVSWDDFNHNDAHEVSADSIKLSSSLSVLSFDGVYYVVQDGGSSEPGERVRTRKRLMAPVKSVAGKGVLLNEEIVEILDEANGVISSSTTQSYWDPATGRLLSESITDEILVTSLLQPGFPHVSEEYDEGMLTRRTTTSFDPYGRVETVTLESFGNDPVSQVQQYNPGSGTLQSVSREGQLISSYEYFPPGSRDFGKIKTVTNHLRNQTVEYTYDKCGKIGSVSSSSGGDLEITYDEYQQVARVNSVQRRSREGVRLESKWVDYRYDESTGLIVEKVFSDGYKSNFSYTIDGKLDSVTRINTTSEGSGITVTYRYDERGRVEKIIYADVEYTLTYDSSDRIETVSGGSVQHVFAYDETTRKVTETIFVTSLHGQEQMNLQVETQFDDKGRKVNSKALADLGAGWQQSLVAETSYTWDDFDRLQSVDSAAGHFNYIYDDVEKYTLADLVGPVVSTRYEYDEFGRTLCENSRASGSVISSHSYEFGDDGRISTRTKSGDAFDTYSNSIIEAIVYDDRGRLSSAETSDNSGIFRSNMFGYDKFDNLLTMNSTLEGVQTEEEFRINKDDSVRSKLLNGVEDLFQYDGEGNLEDDGVYRYEWNSRGLMTAVDVLSRGLRVEFVYDFREQLIARTVWDIGGDGTLLNPRNTYFANSGLLPLLEVTRDSSNGEISETSYTWGRDISGTTDGAAGWGGMLAVTKLTPGGSTPVHRHVAYDGFGSISELLDSSGMIVAHFEYDPFGRRIVAEGPEAADFEWGYSTKRRDSSSGLINFGRRFYHPGINRWMSRDPIEEGDGFNLYAFVGNDPVNNIDLIGEHRFVGISNPKLQLAEPGGSSPSANLDTLLEGVDEKCREQCLAEIQKELEDAIGELPEDGLLNRIEDAITDVFGIFKEIVESAIDRGQSILSKVSKFGLESNTSLGTAVSLFAFGAQVQLSMVKSAINNDQQMRSVAGAIAGGISGAVTAFVLGGGPSGIAIGGSLGWKKGWENGANSDSIGSAVVGSAAIGGRIGSLASLAGLIRGAVGFAVLAVTRGGARLATSVGLRIAGAARSGAALGRAGVARASSVFSGASGAISRAASRVAGRSTRGAGNATARIGNAVSRSRAPTRGADFLGDTGRLGGQLYDPKKLAQLEGYLGRRGVTLKVGDEFLAPGKAGGFAHDGSALYLRSNPTQYEVWHELAHFRQFQKLGPEAYKALPRSTTFNAPEQFVFDLLENSSKRWNSLNFQEQQHAIRYIERIGGFR